MGAASKVTLKEIALRAGCSKGAVSATLNGARGNIGVSSDLRKKIETLARKLGYEANHSAQSLSKGASRTIGLVTGPSAHSHHSGGMYGLLIDGVGDVVRAAGSDLLIIGPAQGEDEIARGLRYICQRRIDALIIPELLYRKRLASLDLAGQPVVAAVAERPAAVPSVYIDFDSGISEALDHLVSLGHREVLWVGWKAGGREISPLRNESFRRVARLKAIAPAFLWLEREVWTVNLPGDIETAREQFAAFLSRHPCPTAVMPYNERMAMGVYRALADHGLRVPQDVSVIGFDDILADLADPPMTVVNLGFEAIGRACAEIALEMAARPPRRPRAQSGAPERRLVPTHLSVRQSVGPPTKRPRSAIHQTKTKE